MSENKQKIIDKISVLEVNGTMLGLLPQYDSLVDAVMKLDGNITDVSIQELKDIRTGGYRGQGIFELLKDYLSVKIETPEGQQRRLVTPVNPSDWNNIEFISESRLRHKNLGQNNGFGALMDAAEEFAKSPKNIFRQSSDFYYNILCSYKNAIEHSNQKLERDLGVSLPAVWHLSSMMDMLESDLVKNMDRINGFFLENKQSDKAGHQYFTYLKESLYRNNNEKTGDILTRLSPKMAKEYGFYHKYQNQMLNMQDLASLYIYKIVSDDLIRGKVHQLSFYLNEYDTSEKLDKVAKLIKESSPVKAKAMINNLFRTGRENVHPEIIDKIYTIMKENHINLSKTDPWFIKPLMAIYNNNDLSKQEKSILQDKYITTTLTGDASEFYSNKLAYDIYKAKSKEVIKDLIDTMEHNSRVAFMQNTFSKSELNPIKAEQAENMIGFYGFSYISAHKDTIQELMYNEVVTMDDIYIEPDTLINACRVVESGLYTAEELKERSDQCEEGIEKNDCFSAIILSRDFTQLQDNEVNAGISGIKDAVSDDEISEGSLDEEEEAEDEEIIPDDDVVL